MFKKGNQINTGRIPWNKGISHAPEVCKKISETRKTRGTSKKQLESLFKMSKNNKGKKLSEKHKEAIRKANTGKVISEGVKLKISKSLRGKISSRRGATLSEETRKKIGIASLGRKNIFKGIKRPELGGINHWNWKGGITTINESLRKSIEYKLWRTAVFERDNYTCVWCGKKGGNLNADHIKSFAHYPELRFAIDNGRTLCVPCHRTTDTFAGRSRGNKNIK